MARRQAGSLLEKRVLAVAIAGILPYEWSVSNKHQNQARVWHDWHAGSQIWHVNHLRDAAFLSDDDRFLATWLAIKPLVEMDGDWEEKWHYYRDHYEIDLRRLV